ncbi:hypothetical protein EXIGUO8H_10871 [Exiguobacterium sp. 8H]|nr:hypothetical protein EXIGUO8H_10871 [Exiguobacterium sp. 8H]
MLESSIQPVSLDITFFYHLLHGI